MTFGRVITSNLMENYIILHLIKDDKVITALEITIEKAFILIEYITNIYKNETGGTTIILEIHLFNNN